MRRLIIPAMLVLALTVMFAGAAMADDIHLCPVSTGCSASSVIPTTSTTAYVLGAKPAGELFIAILVPVADTSGTWNAGTLWGVLGESPTQTFPTLSSAISQESGATGITAGSFNVSDLDLGAWSSSPQQITLPTKPVGTIFMAFTENSDGSLTLVSPWSSSLVNVSVPEPSSLMLLGFGLLSVLTIAGTKLVKS